MTLITLRGSSSPARRTRGDPHGRVERAGRPVRDRARRRPALRSSPAPAGSSRSRPSTASDPSIHPIRCDVTAESDRSRLVERALDRFGRSTCSSTTPASSGGPDGSRASTEFPGRSRGQPRGGLRALGQLVSEPMREPAAPGSVINVSSMFGRSHRRRCRTRAMSPRSRAVNGLTRELANQWARDGVRVNAIAPGWFPTDMNDDLVRRTSARGGGSSASARWAAWAGRTSSTACSSSSRRMRRPTAPAR